MHLKKWVVTGAAGFVGSHVCRFLCKKGYQTVAIDNLSSGTVENIEDLLTQENFDFKKEDLRDTQKIHEIFNKFKPDGVIHLAAIVSVTLCETDPALAKSVNEQAFEDLIQLSQKYAVKKFIYASSSAVYGNAEEPIVSESAPLAAIGIYGKTKIANEKCAGLIQNDSFQRIGLRFFNLFGSSKSKVSAYAAVIPLWKKALLAGKAPIIYGDGNATRDFCHIENVLQAIEKTMHHSLPGHTVMNIGTGIPTTLNTLYQTLCEVYGVNIQPEYQPWRPEDILHSCSKIDLARKIIGYDPKVMLKEGLEQ